MKITVLISPTVRIENVASDFTNEAWISKRTLSDALGLSPKKINNIVDDTLYSCINEDRDVLYELTTLDVDSLTTFIDRFNHNSDIELLFIDGEERKGESDYDKYLNLKSQMVGSRLYYPQISYTIPQDSVLPHVYLVDIDGTVANRVNRNPYDMSKVDEDELIEEVADVLNNIHKSGSKIIYLSGRDSEGHELTEKWLKDNKIWFEGTLLFTRTTKDQRRDSVIKEEIYNREIRDKYYVKGVFDDRLQVQRECWNKLGFTVFNVNQTLKNF